MEEYELAERGPGRWVVTWWLPLPAMIGRARKSRYHAYYHRVVGLAMRLCPHDVLGRKLPRPRLVPPDKWGEYEVDHANDNTLDNRLANLEPMQRDRHREKRRPRLKHAQKVRMVGDLKKKPAANGVMMKYTVASS